MELLQKQNKFLVRPVDLVNQYMPHKTLDKSARFRTKRDHQEEYSAQRFDYR